MLMRNIAGPLTLRLPSIKEHSKKVEVHNTASQSSENQKLFFSVLETS